jgi:hypothetical protein
LGQGEFSLGDPVGAHAPPLVADWSTSMATYHKRSNVETAFSTIKTNLGHSVLSKSRTGQIDEVLCEILAHNIVVVGQSRDRVRCRTDSQRVMLSSGAFQVLDDPRQRLDARRKITRYTRGCRPRKPC